MKLQFTKMHSLGNDFIVIDDRDYKLKNLSGLAKRLCDRRFGIGADQMLVLRNSRTGDFHMSILNADGSEVEMCGNGIRCLGKYIWERILKINISSVGKHPEYLSISTLAGVKHLEKTGRQIRVDMGEPIFEPEKIPVNINQQSVFKKGTRGTAVSSLVTHHSSLILDFPLKIRDKTFKITCVSMGNPHAITVVKDVDSVKLDSFGPVIEHHQLFPKRTNVEFIQVIDRNNIKMRVWERGAGETMACGTGASASAVAASLLGLTGRKVTVHLPGGKLRILWSDKDNHVYMTGDAVEVFSGIIGT